MSKRAKNMSKKKKAEIDRGIQLRMRSHGFRSPCTKTTWWGGDYFPGPMGPETPNNDRSMVSQAAGVICNPVRYALISTYTYVHTYTQSQ